MTVAVLIIQNRYGLHTSAHATEESAKATLYEYVAKHWGDEAHAENDWGDGVPEDRDEAIGRYFESIWIDAPQDYMIDLLEVMP